MNRIAKMTEEVKKITFDPTINLGHILTFIGFLIAIATAFVTLDKRVIIVETSLRTQEMRDRFQDSEINKNSVYVTNSMEDLKRSVEKLSDKVDRINK